MSYNLYEIYLMKKSSVKHNIGTDNLIEYVMYSD
jgi:hypothetical protein